MSEYLHVEKPFLDQLASLDWAVIDHFVLPRVENLSHSRPAANQSAMKESTHILLSDNRQMKK